MVIEARSQVHVSYVFQRGKNMEVMCQDGAADPKPPLVALIGTEWVVNKLCRQPLGDTLAEPGRAFPSTFEKSCCDILNMKVLGS